MLVSGVLLFLFWLRKILGNGLLFAAIGVFQYMQVFLVHTVSYKISPGIVVSPGSAVFFSANLFIVLLIYIREDARILRTLIYALVTTNIVLSLLLYTIGFNIENPAVLNPYQLPAEFFVVNVRLLLIGTAILFLDGLLIILAYEYISKFVSSLFFRIFFTMAFVLITDAILFSIGGFIEHEDFRTILISGVISKSATAFVFSIFFTLYLLFLEKATQDGEPDTSFRDVFFWLSYRQKFERVSVEKEHHQKALYESERRFELMVQAQTEVIIRWKTDGTVLFVNDAFCQFFGHKREEITGQSFFPYTSDKNLLEIKKMSQQFSPAAPYYNWEETGFSKDQSPYWIEWKEVAFFDELGHLSEIQSVGRIMTEHKLTQRALRESEKKYKALFEQGGDAIYLADMNGRIFEANIGASLQLGFSKEEFMQKNLRELHSHPISIEKANTFWKSLTLHTPIHHEGLHQKKDGSSIPVEITTSKIQLFQEDYILGFVRDVSARKEAQKKQMELMYRNKSILETTLDGFILSNLDGSILEVNEAYSKMIGYSQAELLNMSLAELDVKLKPEEVQAVIDSLLATGGARLETTHLSKEGKRIELEVSVSTLEVAGAMLTVNFCRDITNSKQLDEWKKLNASILEKTTQREPLEAILSAITAGIDKLIPDAICSIMLLNEKKQLVVSGSSKLPTAWIEYINERTPGPNVGSCGTAVHFSERIVSADIETDSRWVDFREIASKYELRACWSEPIIDGEQNLPLGTFGVYFQEKRQPSSEEIKLMESVADLLSLILKKIYSERELAEYSHQLEQKVNLRTKELKNTNKELKSFSYSVSHDLRAPLTRLDGFSKVLQDRYSDKLDEKGLHYLNRIRAASQQMAILIDDLLHLSRISRKEVKRELVDIGQLAQNIIVRLQEADPERNIELKIAPKLTSYADKGLTQLMLENLLQNAWKFSQKKEITLIELGEIKDNGSSWFYIKDNGIGFDMKYYDQLFQPFHRLHSAVEIEGTGIGLATVQRIINRHGGFIKAEGQPHQGATFYFRL